MFLCDFHRRKFGGVRKLLSLYPDVNVVYALNANGQLILYYSELTDFPRKSFIKK